MRQFVRTGAARLGIDIRRRPPNLHPSLTRFDARRRRYLEAAGIDLVVDVGANEGQFSRRLRPAQYAGRIMSFEPLPAAFRQLEDAAADDPEWDVINAAVGSSEGTTTLHVAGNSWSSSTLPMGDRHVAAAPESAIIGAEHAGR